MNNNKNILIVGLALFSMFFGAGNLIFPPFLGFHSGAGWLPALIGFILTGVGLPLLGVYATLKSGGNIMSLGRPLGKTVAGLIGIIVILSIGPLYAIPRTAATVHEIGVQTFFPNTPPWVTAVIFFAIVIYTSLNNLRVVDRLGKILTPFLIITLAAIIIAGIAHPLSHVTETPATAYTFGGGFTEGYQTMDALAATMFAGVVMTHVISLGYKKQSEQLSVALRAGVIGILLLGVVYGGLGYIGATGYGIFDAEITRTDLLVSLANGVLGSAGKYLLAVAIALACLTTAIGLTTTCGEYFQGISKGKLPYRAIVVVTAVVSGAISVIGVDTMVYIAVPFLLLMYPVLMVLILFNCFDFVMPNDATYIGGVIGALPISILSALSTLCKLLGNEAMAGKLSSYLELMPLHQFGLEWVIPTVVLAVVFSFFGKKTKNV